MAMKLSIFLICNLISIAVFGQESIAEILIEKTIMIEFDNGESGSGLIYQDGTSCYLVTARHVILEEIKDDSSNTIYYTPKGPKVILWYYSDETEKSLPNSLEINLNGLYKKGYLKYSTTSDILICKIGETDTIGFNKIIYDSENVKKKEPRRINLYSEVNILSFEESKLGNDIFIFGYPKALGLEGNNQYDFNRPILRRGVIAGKYVDNKTIVIDCPSFGGNSGGPVVEILKEPFTQTAKLIGIVVNFIPLAEIWYNPRYNIKNIELVNSGYSVIEPIDKIYDLIDQITVVH